MINSKEKHKEYIIKFINNQISRVINNRKCTIEDIENLESQIIQMCVHENISQDEIDKFFSMTLSAKDKIREKKKKYSLQKIFIGKKTKGLALAITLAASTFVCIGSSKGILKTNNDQIRTSISYNEDIKESNVMEKISKKISNDEVVEINFDGSTQTTIGEPVITTTTTYATKEEPAMVINEEETLVVNNDNHDNIEITTNEVEEKPVMIINDESIEEEKVNESVTETETNMEVSSVDETTDFIQDVNKEDITSNIASKTKQEMTNQILEDNNISIATSNEVLENNENTSSHQVYNVSQDEFNKLVALVYGEDGGSYDGALAVMSTILNRAESSKWSYLGTTPIAQATASGQFAAWNDSRTKQCLKDPNIAPDYVKQAVTDALNGSRNHNYTLFRANNGHGREQIGEDGNYYFK